MAVLSVPTWRCEQGLNRTRATLVRLFSHRLSMLQCCAVTSLRRQYFPAIDACSLPDIAAEPNQPGPSFVFPKCQFGKKVVVKRSCQADYFRTWPWLTYDEQKDAVFCHTCVMALKAKKMTLKRGDAAFVSKGFSNWKDATISFKKHESSLCHKEAVQLVIVLPATCPDVGEMLSTELASPKRDNRQCLLKILSNLQFLARQGLPLRGDGSDADSNFTQLLVLRGQDDPRIAEWMAKKTNKYVSHNVQNELMKVMALAVLRKIAASIQQSEFFSIMCDECTDLSNNEQLVICIRWVSSDQLEPHEDILGLYKVDDICTNTIVHVIKDTLVRLNLSMTKCRGQCYDGASNMSGVRSGVAKQLRDAEPRALFMHCHGHALNLAAGDAIKQSKVMKDALDTTFEVSKLVKFSPKRGAVFDKLKEELATDSPGFRVLCPTRWTVRAEFLKSVMNNYTVLQELWHISKDQASDPSIRARIIGVEAQFKTFRYFFGVHLGELILQHTDNLSRTLQSPEMSASEGANVAAMAVATLETIRSDAGFDAFWEIVMLHKRDVDIDEPELPRRRRVPSRFQEGTAEPEHFSDAKIMYRQTYFEAIDLIINAIKDRFNQPGFQIYRNLQDLLLLALNGKNWESSFASVTSLYKDDIDADQLRLHVQMLCASFPTIDDVKQYIIGLTLHERQLLSEVVTVVKLILVMPSINAVSERSFSAMRRLKTYLRTTMKQERLNHLLLLHVHKDHTDDLSSITVANTFVGDSEHRLCLVTLMHVTCK